MASIDEPRPASARAPIDAFLAGIETLDRELRVERPLDFEDH